MISGLPVRICVGCGERAAKSELLRVVGRGDEVLPDPRAWSPGRGAYVHPREDCLERALRRKAFGRALRMTGPVDTGPVGRYLAGERGGHRSAASPGMASEGGPAGTNSGVNAGEQD